MSAHSDLSGSEDLELFRKCLEYTCTSKIQISKLSQGPVQGLHGQIIIDSQLILYELKESGFSKWLVKGNA